MKAELTRELAWAIAQDCGTRQMKKAGRCRWDLADYNHAVSMFNDLWPEPLNPTEADIKCLEYNPEAIVI